MHLIILRNMSLTVTISTKSTKTSDGERVPINYSDQQSGACFNSILKKSPNLTRKKKNKLITITNSLFFLLIQTYDNGIFL